MSKKLTPFESALKEKMSGYEAPYDIKSWYSLEKVMGFQAKSNSPWIVALVATCLVSGAIGYGVYNYNFNGSEALLVNHASKRFESVSAENIRSQHSQNVLFYIEESQNNNIGAESNSILAFNKPEFETAKPSSGLVVENSAKPTEPTQPEELENASSTPAVITKALTLVSNISEGCAGTEIDFKATNGPSSNTSYLWNFGDGRFSKEKNPKHKFSKPGKYDITLSVTSNDGQIRTVLMNDMITIFPAPEANFEWNFVNNSPDKIAVQIVNSSNNSNSYDWKFEDGTTSSLANPMKEIERNGKHSVVLHVSNEYGCKDDIIKQISVNSDFNVGASQTYYPEKESYMPSGLKAKDLNFEMTIYDLAGHKIYQTSSYTKGWNGKLANGASAPAGEYQWKVLLKNNKSEEKYFNGVFTVFP